jgi:hypothetical protein
VKIWVVVENIQVRTLKAEVEKGFARTAFDRESVDPEAQINLVNRTIGPIFFPSFGKQFLKGGLGGGSKSGCPKYVERESGLTFLNLYFG